MLTLRRRVDWTNVSPRPLAVLRGVHGGEEVPRAAVSAQPLQRGEAPELGGGGAGPAVYGLADVARRVMGCSLTQETRV